MATEEQIQIALAICESESFAWLMVGSSHTEIRLNDLRPAWGEYVKSGGGYFNRARPNIKES